MESLQKEADEKNFPKKKLDDCGLMPSEKKS